MPELPAISGLYHYGLSEPISGEPMGYAVVRASNALIARYIVEQLHPGLRYYLAYYAR